MGLTSAAETAEVVQWAKQYPEVAAEIEAIQLGLESYTQTHAVAPDVSVKEKLFASINATQAAPVIGLKTAAATAAKVYSIPPAWKYVAAASIILLVGSLIFNYMYYNKYQSANTELATTQSELQKQKDIARAMDDDMSVIAD